MVEKSGRIKVFVAEDDAASRLLLRTLLLEWGYDVILARDGIEALGILEGADAPLLALLDWMMPGMDGFEFLEHIQIDPMWSRIPVVILTAKTLGLNEIERLSKVSEAILTKGRDDTVQMIDAILKSVLPKRREPAEAIS